MFGQPEGYIIVDKEITHSPEPGMGPTSKGMQDLTPIYFKALKGKMVPVMDVAVDGDQYLVLGKSEEVGDFMWYIDKKDTIGKLIPYELLHPLSDLEKSLLFFLKVSKGIPLTKEDEAELDRLCSISTVNFP